MQIVSYVSIKTLLRQPHFFVYSREIISTVKEIINLASPLKNHNVKLRDHLKG
ncbi:MAG: hypothetical protein PHH93_03555 [Prolixibacteraceae bacterium]|nr:hypothetical protein [Prolixibacteraceae bacterium]